MSEDAIVNSRPYGQQRVDRGTALAILLRHKEEWREGDLSGLGNDLKDARIELDEVSVSGMELLLGLAQDAYACSVRLKMIEAAAASAVDLSGQQDPRVQYCQALCEIHYRLWPKDGERHYIGRR